MTLPTILYFTAKWCGPCRMLRPIMEDIGRDHANVAVIDIDENPDITTEYDVLSVPTLVLLDTNNGNEIDRLVGAKPKKVIIRELGL